MSIFQTDAWQNAWWREWGQARGFQLLEQGGSGASGVYIDKYLLKGLIPLRCLQFVGTNYRRISTRCSGQTNQAVCKHLGYEVRISAGNEGGVLHMGAHA